MYVVTRQWQRGRACFFFLRGTCPIGPRTTSKHAWLCTRQAKSKWKDNLAESGDSDSDNVAEAANSMVVFLRFYRYRHKRAQSVHIQNLPTFSPCTVMPGSGDSHQVWIALPQHWKSWNCRPPPHNVMMPPLCWTTARISGVYVRHA